MPHDVLYFELFVFSVFGLVATIVYGIAHFDSIAVRLMRSFNIHLFPTAISIAMSIVERPEEWEAYDLRLSHRVIGRIWTANEAYGLKIETECGTWVPSKIERRIIRDAVDWRLNQYIRGRVEAAMQGYIEEHSR